MGGGVYNDFPNQRFGASSAAQKKPSLCSFRVWLPSSCSLKQRPRPRSRGQNETSQGNPPFEATGSLFTLSVRRAPRSEVRSETSGGEKCRGVSAPVASSFPPRPAPPRLVLGRGASRWAALAASPRLRLSAPRLRPFHGRP